MIGIVWSTFSFRMTTAAGFPRPTGDPRRYPDCGAAGRGLYDYTEWLDADLRRAVIASWGGIWPRDALWTFINVFDAAIDEMDRRRGLELKPVVRER